MNTFLMSHKSFFLRKMIFTEYFAYGKRVSYFCQAWQCSLNCTLPRNNVQKDVILFQAISCVFNIFICIGTSCGTRRYVK